VPWMAVQWEDSAWRVRANREPTGQTSANREQKSQSRPIRRAKQSMESTVLAVHCLSIGSPVALSMGSLYGLSIENQSGSLLFALHWL
jgi:hypothetical protein